jgi:hypothetical protein
MANLDKRNQGAIDYQGELFLNQTFRIRNGNNWQKKYSFDSAAGNSIQDIR